MEACLTMCLSCNFFFPFLTHQVTKCLTRLIVEKNSAVCNCLLFVLKQNHSPPHPFIPVLTPNLPLLLSPSWWLSNQIHLSSSLGQSHHIETRWRSEEGYRRRRDHLWDIGLRDRHPLLSITGGKTSPDYFHLSLTWAEHYSRLQAPEKILFFHGKRLKEQTCLVPTLLYL